MKKMFGLLGLAAVLTASACGPSAPPGGGATTVGTTARGTLASTDPQVTVNGNMRYADTWTVNLTMGMPYTILMCEEMGSDFDPYLQLEGPGLMEPLTNDDSARGYNGHGSRIVVTPTMTGDFTIRASTFRTPTSSTVGIYTLQVLSGDMSTLNCPGG